MTPFSLSELGLSDEEINLLGLGDTAAAERPAESEATAANEPDMTPFSLSELGLSDDEIAALGLGEAPVSEPAAEPEATAANEPDMTPFSLSELGLSDDEIAALGLGEAPVSEPAAEPPAEPEAPTMPAIEATPPPSETAAFEEEQHPAAETPAADIGSVATVPVTPPAAPAMPHLPRPPAAGDEELAATGNDILDAFLQQLHAEPENDVLRLSVARVSGQIGQTELAVRQYKYLIKHNRLLSDVVQELQELIEYSEERRVLQQLHRVLGDAYSKQGKLREAVEAYSWRG
jgi:hypothetical protein